MKNEADSLDSSLITQLKDVPQAQVDAEEMMEDFCSQTCLSIKAASVGSKSQCNMCSRHFIVRDVGLMGHPGFDESKETCVTVVRYVSSLQSKHEIIYQGVNHEICSKPCFYRFCNISDFCVNCHTHCDTPVQLKVVDGSRKFCTAACLALFKQVTQYMSKYLVQTESSVWRTPAVEFLFVLTPLQKIKTLQPCAMCCSPRLMSHMVEKKNNDRVVELFCTKSCVMASKIQAINASGAGLLQH